MISEKRRKEILDYYLKIARRRIVLENSQLIKEKIYSELKGKGFKYTEHTYGSGLDAMEYFRVQVSGDPTPEGVVVKISIPTRAPKDKFFVCSENPSAKYSRNKEEMIINDYNIRPCLERILEVAEHGKLILKEASSKKKR